MVARLLLPTSSLLLVVAAVVIKMAVGVEPEVTEHQQVRLVEVRQRKENFY
jgi:hypothetical protein